MPIKLNDKTYPLPGEKGSSGFTGAEIIGIEDHFNLDGLTLISALSSTTPSAKGYTRVKALYAVAWVVMCRAGEICSINDVLNDLSIDQIEPLDDDEDLGKAQTASSEVATAKE